MLNTFPLGLRFGNSLLDLKTGLSSVVITGQRNDPTLTTSLSACGLDLIGGESWINWLLK
jgi:hypothetical protein